MVTTANSFGLSQQTGPSDPGATHRDVYACVADAGWITGHTYIVSRFVFFGPGVNSSPVVSFPFPFRGVPSGPKRLSFDRTTYYYDAG